MYQERVVFVSCAQKGQFKCAMRSFTMRTNRESYFRSKIWYSDSLVVVETILCARAHLGIVKYPTPRPRAQSTNHVLCTRESYNIIGIVQLSVLYTVLFYNLS